MDEMLGRPPGCTESRSTFTAEISLIPAGPGFTLAAVLRVVE